MKKFIQLQLSYLSKKLKVDIFKFNDREKDGYKNTILSFKSKLHNVSEKNYYLFEEAVLNEYKRVKTLNYWTDYQKGRKEAIEDMADLIMMYKCAEED